MALPPTYQKVNTFDVGSKQRSNSTEKEAERGLGKKSWTKMRK